MSHSQYSVLHVDDDPDMTKLVAHILGESGINCIEVNNPFEAMHQIREHNIRVVILDLDMPGMHGLELLRRIKNHDGGINVIILTAIVTQSTVIQSLRWGACACVFKPLHTSSRLVASVLQAFDNVDRWWSTLRELIVLRRDASCETPMSDDDISTLVSSCANSGA